MDYGVNMSGTENKPQDPAGTGGPGVAEAEGGRWAELLAPHYLATTTMLCLGVALFAFNSFLVTTALPTAVAELGGAQLISWALSLFLTASIMAGMTAVLFKRRLGGRHALVLAGLIFLVGTLICASAQSMPMVLVGRVLQGIGDGLVAAICYSLIPDMFPSRLVPKVFGAEAVVWAVAAFAGPVLSGWLTETLSWRAAFLINGPMIAIFLALALMIAPRRASGAALPFRLPGLRLLLLCLGLTAILAAGVSLPLLAAALVVGAAAALIGTVALDRRAAHPLMPKSAFSLGNPLGLSLWVVLLMPVAQATNGVYLIYGLQHLWGLGPTAAGATGALMAICWSLVAIIVANVHRREDQNRLIWLGTLCQVSGMALSLCALATDMIMPIFAGQVLIGTGFGMSWGYLSKLAMDVSSAEERDKTSALLPTLQSTGFALGGGIAGLVANAGGLTGEASHSQLQGALVMTYGLATLMVLPAIAAARRAVRLARGM